MIPEVFAQNDIGEYTPPSGLPSGDISDFTGTAFDAFLPIAIGIAVLMLLFAGIQYALSGGEEEKQAKAKRMIKWTIIGLFLALLAYGIVAFIVNFLG